MIVCSPPQAIADWVCAQRGVAAPAVDVALGYISGGRLRAGVYFDCATANNVFTHIASDSEILPRGLLRATATLVYRTYGMSRMTLMVPDSHVDLVKFVEGMGAVREATLTNGSEIGEDLHLYALYAHSPFIRRLLK